MHVINFDKDGFNYLKCGVHIGAAVGAIALQQESHTSLCGVPMLSLC